MGPQVDHLLEPVLAVEVPEAGGLRVMFDTETDLSSRDVARLLDMSPDRVNELARKQILPGRKTGRQWRFRKQDIASYKRQLREATAA